MTSTKSPYDWARDIVDENAAYRTDYIVTLRIDLEEISELLLYEWESDSYYWQNDWYEGQKIVEVLGFLPVSEIKIHNYPKR